MVEPAARPASQKCLVNSCCGCFSLKTGCTILAVFNLIGSALLFGLFLWLSIAETPVFLIGVAVSVIVFILFCFVVRGIQRETVSVVKSWLWFCVVSFILSTIESLREVISGDFETLTATIISIILNVYFIIVIHSYTQELIVKQSTVENEVDYRGLEAANTGNDEGGFTEGYRKDQKYIPVDLNDPSQSVINPNFSTTGPQPMMYPGQQPPYPAGQQPMYPAGQPVYPMAYPQGAGPYPVGPYGPPPAGPYGSPMPGQPTNAPYMENPPPYSEK